MSNPLKSLEKGFKKANNVAKRAVKSTDRFVNTAQTSGLGAAAKGAKRDFKSDYKATERDVKEVRDDVTNLAASANSGLVRGSRKILGNDLTEGLAPTGVALDRIAQSRNQGASLGDAFTNSANRSLNDMHRRTSDTVRNIGTEVFNEDEKEGTAFFQGAGSFIDRFSGAEGNMVNSTGAGTQQVLRGDVSAGASAIDDSQREFWSDPAVQSVALTAMSMGVAGPALAAYMSTTFPAMAAALGTTGMSMLTSGLTQGLSAELTGGEFAKGALQGAVTGGVASGLNGYAPFDSTMANAATRGAISGAVRPLLTGGNSREYLQSIGGGALGGVTGQVGREMGGTTGAVVAGGLGGAGGAALAGGDRNQILQSGVSGATLSGLGALGGKYGGKSGSQLATTLGRQYLQRKQAPAPRPTSALGAAPSQQQRNQQLARARATQRTSTSPYAAGRV